MFDMRNALAAFKLQAIPGAVTLFIGLVIAWVVTFCAGLVLVITLVGSGGKLPGWALYIPILLGGMFAMVALGSVTRSMVAEEDGGTLRQHGWAVVPTGLLGISVANLVFVMLGQFTTGLVGVVVALAMSWMFIVAVVDVACGNGEVGLLAPLRVLARKPVRALGNVVAAVVLADVPLVILATLVHPWAAYALVPAAIVLKLLLVIECYGAVEELPMLRAARIAAADADARSKRLQGRSQPSFLIAPGAGGDARRVQAAAALGGDATPGPDGAIAVPGAATMAGPAAGIVVLDVPFAAGHGAWLQCPDTGVLTVSVVVAPPGSVAGRTLLSTPDGVWIELAAAAQGAARGAVPPGPWFVLVEGLASGGRVGWRLDTASSPGVVIGDAAAQGGHAA